VDIGVKPIDGNLWFRFIAKGALGGQLSQQPQIEYGFCYDFNFRKGCFRMNCRYRHVHTLNLCILLSGKFKIEHFEDLHQQVV
jgi:hypothetical protein